MAFNVGDRNSAKRNEAFALLKAISSAIGHSRNWSASDFRNMTRSRAAQKRREVGVALKGFASSEGVQLSNANDPLVTYSTAQANLATIQDVTGAMAGYDIGAGQPPPPPPPEDEFYANGDYDSGTYDPPLVWEDESGTGALTGWESLSPTMRTGIAVAGTGFTAFVLFKLVQTMRRP